MALTNRYHGQLQILLGSSKVIARSDLFILVVSASLLAAGIVRWQNNMSSLSVASHSIQQNTTLNSQNSLAGNSTTNTVNNSNVMGATTSNNLSVSAVSNNNTQLARNVQLPASPAGVTTGNASVSVPATLDTNRQGDSAVAPSPNVSGQANEPLYGVYVVVSGDILGRIAQTYGTSVATLQEINNIDGSLIEIGQEIKYPLPAN